MPRSSNRSVTAYSVFDIDKYPLVEDGLTRKEKERAFRKKLRPYALEKIRVEVLVLRFVYGWPFSEISEKLKIPHRPTAFDIYKRSIELLKERGFKLLLVF